MENIQIKLAALWTCLMLTYKSGYLPKFLGIIRPGVQTRKGTLLTEGSDWPVWLTIRPSLVGLASLTIIIFISRHWRFRSLRRSGDGTVLSHI